MLSLFLVVVLLSCGGKKKEEEETEEGEKQATGGTATVDMANGATIMGTVKDMDTMIRLIAQAGIEPEIGSVLPMKRAAEGFLAMWEGQTHGKTVFTR